MVYVTMSLGNHVIITNHPNYPFNDLKILVIEINKPRVFQQMTLCGHNIHGFDIQIIQFPFLDIPFYVFPDFAH